jgi:hypothetical protein
MSKHCSPGSAGARNELLVCADLIRTGWLPFRSLSPNGPVDLLAVKRGTVLKIQVRTECQRSALRGNDVLAVVRDGVVRYRARTQRIARKLIGCEVVH